MRNARWLMNPVPPTPDGAARLLVTTVTGGRPGDGDPVVALFTTSFGFRRGPVLDLGHADTLCEQLRDLAGEDTVVVAIAAHGYAVEDDDLLLSEPPGERPGVRVGEIVTSLLAGSPARRLALLLDVRCDPGSAERAVAGRLRAESAGASADGAVLEVVLATTPATARESHGSAAAPAPFAVLFSRAAMSPASGGPAQPVLTL